MPQVISIIATVAIGSIKGAGIYVALFKVGLIIGVNYVVSQAFLTPLENGTTELITGIKGNTDGPVTPQKIIYGNRRVGGAVVYRNMTDEGYLPGTELIETKKANENLYYHTCIALCGHELNSIGSIYFNDELLTYQAHPNYSNIYKVSDDKYNKVNTDGSVSLEAFVQDDSISENFASTNSLTAENLVKNASNLLIAGDKFTLEGVTYAGNGTGSNKMASQPFTITSALNSNELGTGTLIFTPAFRIFPGTSDSRTNRRTTRKDKRRLYTDRVISITSNVLLLIKKGLDPQFDLNNQEDIDELDLLSKAGYKEFNRYTQDPDTEFPIRTRVVVDGEFGDSTSFMNGISFIYARLRFHPESFTRIPNINCVVEGKKCFDNRTSTTVYTQNPALILRDYLTSSYGLNLSSSDIDNTYTDVAANICDESVSIASGTQARYTCDLMLSTEATLEDNINKILFSMLGTLIFVDGKFRIFAGAYETPTITIDDSWIVDSVILSPKVSIQDSFNSVTGIYINEGNEFSPTNIPTVTNSTYLTEDNEIESLKEIDLVSQNNVERAQRLAQTFLNLQRSSEVITLICKTIAIQLTPHDMVYLDLPRFSYSSRPYRVISITRNENGLFVLVLKYEVPTIYDWVSTDASIPDVGSSLELPSIEKNWPPSNLTIEEEAYTTTNGSGVKVRAIINFDPSPSGFASSYQLEYKLITDSQYIVLGRTQSNNFTISDISAGLYDFRVKTISETGAYSDYSSKQIEIIGLTAVPADIVNFSLNVVSNIAYLSWDLAAEIDVQVGGSIIIKHNTNLSGATWATSNLLVPELPGITTQASVPLLSGTYLIKAQDSTSNISENAVTIITTVPNITKMNSIATLTESPSFSGVKVNMVSTSNTLILDGVTLFDSVAGNFDEAIGSFDGGNSTGFETSGQYDFSTYIDVGSVLTSRVTIDLDFTIDEPGNFFDDYPGDFDDVVGKFDGDDNDPINVIPYISTTEDDPSGSPTWTDYRRFFLGDYTARAFKFKIEVESSKSNFNIILSALSASVDMPDISDTGNLTTGTGGTTTVSFNKTFQVAPDLGATIQAGNGGDYLLIQNITTTQFDIGVLNSAAYVAKSVSWIAKGY
tara:strand:+ start:5618 stop:8947 length:3330 start_codon:yes stop_codon:yes gene_type:complete